jgi:hypothetical protein
LGLRCLPRGRARRTGCVWVNGSSFLSFLKGAGFDQYHVLAKKHQTESHPGYAAQGNGAQRKKRYVNG